MSFFYTKLVSFLFEFHDYFSVDPNPLSGDLGLSCVVSSDGIVQFNTPYIFISYCKVDLTYYPFDTQRCPLKFGSWSFDETGVDINASRPVPELDKYQPNGEWDLLDMFVTNHKIKYSCCPHKFPDVEYTLVIERKPEFYVANIILPYVLISILSIFVFYLPPESGEKMNLSITTIPPASDGTFPIMGKFYRTCPPPPPHTHGGLAQFHTVASAETIAKNFC